MFPSKFSVVLRRSKSFSAPANFIVAKRTFSKQLTTGCRLIAVRKGKADCKRLLQKRILCEDSLGTMQSLSTSRPTCKDLAMSEGEVVFQKLECSEITSQFRKFSSKQPPEPGCPPIEAKEEDCERLFKKIKPIKDKMKGCVPKKQVKQASLCKEKVGSKSKSSVQQCESKTADPPDPCKKDNPCNPLPRKGDERVEGPCELADPCKTSADSCARQSTRACPPKETEIRAKEPCAAKLKEENTTKRTEPCGSNMKGSNKNNKNPCSVKPFKRKSNIDPNKGGAVCKKGGDAKKRCKEGDEMKMCALVFCRESREVSLQKVKIPDHIKKDEVLVQVHFAGINATDFAVLDGKIPTCMDVLIPGREFSGIICGAGEKIEHVKAGDVVTVAPCQPLTTCSYCTDEKSDYCVKDGGADKSLGVDRNGGWAEFSVVPGNSVYKAPEGTEPKEAALLPALAQVMCSLSRLKMDPDMEILILGGGLLGSLMALFLQHNGFTSVTICEDNPTKVKQLECLCTGYPVISPNKIECLALDVVITNGAGGQVMQKALNALKSQGQFVILGPVGGNGDAPEIKIACQEFSRKQIHMLGMMGSPSNPSNIPSALVCSALKDKLNIPVYPLADYKEAMTRVQTGDIGQVLLQVRPECPRCPPKKEKQCGNS